MKLPHAGAIGAPDLRDRHIEFAFFQTKEGSVGNSYTHFIANDENHGPSPVAAIVSPPPWRIATRFCRGRAIIVSGNFTSSPFEVRNTLGRFLYTIDIIGI
jgi:hypothetical protein